METAPIEKKVLLRTGFFCRLFELLKKSGYDYSTSPCIYDYKHGNLIFTDERLTLRLDGVKIFITLEHYFIKREGWHPLYWGLQSFDEQNNKAIYPSTIPAKDSLVKEMERLLVEKYNTKSNLGLIEEKYGWFAWECFDFSDGVGDLEDDRVNIVFESGIEKVVEVFAAKFFNYLNAWEEVVLKFKSGL